MSKVVAVLLLLCLSGCTVVSVASAVVSTGVGVAVDVVDVVTPDVVD